MHPFHLFVMTTFSCRSSFFILTLNVVYNTIYCSYVEDLATMNLNPPNHPPWLILSEKCSSHYLLGGFKNQKFIEQNVINFWCFLFSFCLAMAILINIGNHVYPPEKDCMFHNKNFPPISMIHCEMWESQVFRNLSGAVPKLFLIILSQVWKRSCTEEKIRAKENYVLFQMFPSWIYLPVF